MSGFVPNLAALLNSRMPFSEYLPTLIETVIDTMLKNPQIPIFVLQELSSNPERMPQIIREMGIDPQVAARKMEEDHDERSGILADPRQVILNVLSLCIFPFAARSVVTEVLFAGDEEAYIAAMEERKTLLPVMVRKFMIQNNNL